MTLVSGLFNSCATPATSWPIADSFSAWSSCACVDFSWSTVAVSRPLARAELVAHLPQPPRGADFLGDVLRDLHDRRRRPPRRATGNVVTLKISPVRERDLGAPGRAVHRAPRQRRSRGNDPPQNPTLVARRAAQLRDRTAEERPRARRCRAAAAAAVEHGNGIADRVEGLLPLLLARRTTSWSRAFCTATPIWPAMIPSRCSSSRSNRYGSAAATLRVPSSSSLTSIGTLMRAPDRQRLVELRGGVGGEIVDDRRTPRRDHALGRSAAIPWQHRRDVGGARLRPSISYSPVTSLSSRIDPPAASSAGRSCSSAPVRTSSSSSERAMTSAISLTICSSQTPASIGRRRARGLQRPPHRHRERGLLRNVDDREERSRVPPLPAPPRRPTAQAPRRAHGRATDSQSIGQSRSPDPKPRRAPESSDQRIPRFPRRLRARSRSAASTDVWRYPSRRTRAANRPARSRSSATMRTEGSASAIGNGCRRA